MTYGELRMDYANFLEDCDDEALRKEVFALYQPAEDFFDLLGFTMTVETVQECKEGDGCYDADKKLIEIPVSADDKGAIFHEATHDFFHHSCFHRNYNPANGFGEGEEEDPTYNETWGEGFCEAVRWLMESKFLQGSEWLAKTFPNGTKPDWRKKRAKRILDYFGWDLDSFAANWKKLVADYDMTGDFLNRTIPSTAQ